MTIDPEVAALNDNTKYTEKYEYNQFGEKTKVYDALGNATLYTYNKDGKILTVTDGTGNKTTFTYNLAGDKQSLTDAGGKVSAYTYGSNGILLSCTDQESRADIRKYDLNLNQVYQKDRNNNEIVSKYDSKNLLIEKTAANVSTGAKDIVQFAYDTVGNRSKMVDKNGITTYSYDENNRLLSKSKDGAAQISYSYDDVRNVATVTDKTGYVVTYSYDKSNRMKSVTFEEGVARTTTYTFDQNGNRASCTYDEGVTELYTYDRNNRLLTLTNKRSNGSTISSFNYTYYLNGNQKTKQDSYGTTTYSYDGAGRVTKVEAPGKTTDYVYDKASNRKSQKEIYVSNQVSGYLDKTANSNVEYRTKCTEYEYSSSDRLTKVLERMYSDLNVEVLDKCTVLSYDSNGNEISKTSGFLKVFNSGNAQASNIVNSNNGDQPDGELQAELGAKKETPAANSLQVETALEVPRQIHSQQQWQSLA